MANSAPLDAVGFAAHPATAGRMTGPTVNHGRTAPAPSSESQSAVDVDVDLDGIPDSPPAEVLDAIDRAADAYAQLASQGKHVSFGIDAASGRVQVQLQDRAGRPISGLTPSAALHLADGGSLD